MCEITRGRTGLLIDGEGVDRLLGVVARSLGKRRSAGRLPVEARDGVDETYTWLAAEGVTDVFVGYSERLSEDQLRVLIDWSDLARVWLLFSDDVTTLANALLANLAPAAVHRNSMERWLAIGDSPTNTNWRGFPTLPLDDVFAFRGRCLETLDAAQMDDVDAVIELGVDLARSVLVSARDDATPEEVAGPALAADIPIWPSLAMLRGAQLGALSTGWLLSFDTEAWLQVRRAVPSISPDVVSQLRAAVDPYDAALLVAYVTTCASPATLAEMNVSDVDNRGAVLLAHDHKFDVGLAVRGPLKAHVSNISDPEGPLFPKQNGSRHTPAFMERRLRTVLRRFGLSEAIDSGSRTTGKAAAISDLVSYIDLSLVPRGAL